jgi:response regulator RpfG family c-di-GMP phosphodiesterase
MTDKKMTHTLLLVDDEENILNSLKRLLRRDGHRILTASNGKEGLNVLKRNPVSIIVSDQKMPEMTGSEFLRYAREAAPDAIRIMLTGYADIKAAMDAINKGNVYRFITKPWDDNDLLVTIRQALKQYELVFENKRLTQLTQRQNVELKELNQGLEKKVEERTEKIRKMNRKLKKSFFDTVRVFTGLLSLFDADLVAHSKRVAALSRGIARRLGDMDNSEYEIIELGSLLHDIGLISVPKNLLAKKDGQMSESERKLYQQHPIVGQMSLNGIDNLDQVSILVRAHHEHFDGSGYPGGLKEEEIPIGARIISVADAYDDLVYRHKMPDVDALADIKKRSWTEFDPEIVIHLVSVVKQGAILKDEEDIITLLDLRPGMLLSRDLETYSGRLLVAKETKIKESYISKLISFNEIDPIVERIYVYKKLGN